MTPSPAFSFTKGAREEVARARWERKVDIQLVTVKKLLETKPEEFGPLTLPMADVTDLPITLAQAAKDRPTVEELIASETA